ncbi:hypothetical protein Trydic_g13203 [Trypoxylus dichotomus]
MNDFSEQMNSKIIRDEDLESLISEVVRASNRGVSASKNVSNPPNWSFGQSLFFSTTVVTTIGYGHVTPLSRSGKVFCIIYAMCGIPLTLVLMSALVDKLLKPTMWFQHWLLKHLGNVYQPLHIKLLHLIIVVMLLVIFFLTVPAVIFASIEPEWDFLDSFYYCFISLTTIGLGDYIPGDDRNQKHRALYKILTSCYLVVGLTFMMLTLALFYDIPQLNIGQLFKSHEALDSEKAHLATYGLGLQYGIDSKPGSEEHTHRQVVRVRSRQRDDSPSPEDPPSNDFMKHHRFVHGPLSRIFSTKLVLSTRGGVQFDSNVSAKPPKFLPINEVSNQRSVLPTRGSTQFDLNMSAKPRSFHQATKSLIDDQDIEGLQDRLEGVRNLSLPFSDIQDEIELLTDDEESQEKAREFFENTYYRILGTARHLSKQHTVNSLPAITQHNTTNSITLPKINFPKFNGAYQEWYSFRNTFKSLIHNSESLSNIQKFHYLRMSLTNEAWHIIQSLEVTEDNYAIAWDLLTKRYENKRLIVYKHITRSVGRYAKAFMGSRMFGRTCQILGYVDYILNLINTRHYVATGLGKTISNVVDKILTLKTFKSFLASKCNLLEALHSNSNSNTSKQMINRTNNLITLTITIGSGGDVAARPMKKCPGSKGMRSCGSLESGEKWDVNLV